MAVVSCPEEISDFISDYSVDDSQIPEKEILSLHRDVKSEVPAAVPSPAIEPRKSELSGSRKISPSESLKKPNLPVAVAVAASPAENANESTILSNCPKAVNTTWPGNPVISYSKMVDSDKKNCEPKKSEDDDKIDVSKKPGNAYFMKIKSTRPWTFQRSGGGNFKKKKKLKLKISGDTLKALQAVSQGYLRSEFSKTELFFIDKNSKLREKVLDKVAKYGCIRLQQLIILRVLKREWWSYEKLCLQFLESKSVDVEDAAKNYCRGINNPTGGGRSSSPSSPRRKIPRTEERPTNDDSSAFVSINDETNKGNINEKEDKEADPQEARIKSNEMLQLPDPENYAESIIKRKKVVLNGPVVHVTYDESTECYGKSYLAAKMVHGCNITQLDEKRYFVDDGSRAQAVTDAGDGKYVCSCKPAKTCIHIASIKYFHGEKAEFAVEDPVKHQNRSHPKYAGRSGRKPPRAVDINPDDIDATDFSNNGSTAVNSNGATDYDQGFLLRDTKSSPELQRMTEATERFRAAYSQRFSDIANFTAVPPINAEFDDWFTALLKENVKIHVKGFMYHTFENCVPLLIPGHLCFILTSDDMLLLVKRVTFDTVKVVVIHDIDEHQFYANGSSSDECIWAAAFCGRDADKIKVHMFYQERKYSAQWTAAVLLSKYSVSDEFGVCEVPDEPEDKAQLQQVFAAVPCKKARYKRKTFECYCCCRKPHLDKRSTERSERLKHSKLIQCGKCKSWQYYLCNGIPTEGVSGVWLCSACRPVPLLPKWGPGDVFKPHTNGLINLHGGEDDYIKQFHTSGRIISSSTCTKCRHAVIDKTPSDLSITKFDPSKDNVREFIVRRLCASSVTIRLVCCGTIIREGVSRFCNNQPWMLLLSDLSPAELKTFTLSELLYLPLTVEHPELQQTYFLAGITFHLPNHFVCALRYNNAWMLYDGLKETFAETLPNVLKSIAERKGMLGAIVYLRQD